MSKALSLVAGAGWAIADVRSVIVTLFPHTVLKIRQIHLGDLEPPSARVYIFKKMYSRILECCEGH